MPELPEVETVKRGLQKLLPGRVVSSIKFDWHGSLFQIPSSGLKPPSSGQNLPLAHLYSYGYVSSLNPNSDSELDNFSLEEVTKTGSKSFPNAESDVDEFLISARILEVKRRAKVLLIELSTKYSLVIHLKMTGQLVFRGEENFGAGHPNDSLVGALPDKSTRVTFNFNDGSRLFFNDQRKFGWVRLIPTAEVPNIDFFKKVGPEPLSDTFTAKEFIERFRRRANTTIKAALLDQTVVAGIGNIYADEALFATKLHPALRVRDVSDAKLKQLYKAVRDVLQLSIDKGGSSDKNYVNAEGKRGSYLGFAQVFRREGKPCLRCGHTIEKIRVAGRGTHICPNEQKLPKGYK